MKYRTQSLFSIALIAVFAFLTVVPGIALFKFEGVTRSLVENRDLADLPEVPRSGEALVSWTKRFDDFVADHFGGRETLVALYHYLHVKLGVSPSDRVIIGRDGWLFLEQTFLTDANRGALAFSEPELQRLLASFTKRQQYLSARGIDFLVIPLPDKQSLFPEHLPSAIEFVGPSRLRQFREAMRGAPFDSVDVYPALVAAKDAGEEIYFQTDSHWNSRGAWFAYLEMMRAVREDGYRGGVVLDEADLEFIRLDPYHPTDIVKNLLGLSGWIREAHGIRVRVHEEGNIEAFRPSDGTAYDYLYSPPPGQEHKHFVRTPGRDGSRVLVYRDSYGNAMLPYLVHTFDELIYARPPKSMGFDPADIERYQPDLVIYEFVERALYYPPDDSLMPPATAAGRNP